MRITAQIRRGSPDESPLINTITESSPVAFADELPEAVDAVVIGGGVIGVCTAWYLAKAGVSVLLCEKGRIAGEQSSRNWGWVRQPGRDPDELPIMMEASRMWPGVVSEAGDESAFQREGVLYLASSEAKLAKLEAWLEVAKQHQLDTRLLSAAEVASMVDGKKGQWLGGLYTASDGRAEPWRAVPAMARAARKAGAIIRENCAVRTIDQTDGTVSGVCTESGVVRCERVVLAAGAWSSLFSSNLGIRLPQLSVRASVACTEPATNVFSGNAADEQVAFRRRDDGGYTLAPCDFREHLIGPSSFRYFRQFLPALLDDFSSTRLRSAAPKDYPDSWSVGRQWSADQISPFERIRVLNPRPSESAINRLTSRIGDRLPALKNVRIKESWAGMIDSMPDIVPVIDEVPSPTGLILATGFSGHGFGIGPGAGKLIAEMVQGKSPGHDLHRFRFSRFTDGSKIDLGPAL